MSTIQFSPFSGLIPKSDGAMLPPNAAQIAKNARFSSGQLEAFNLPLTVVSSLPDNINTIYRFGQTTNSDTDYWFTFSNVVDVVKGPIANDTTERTFYTGDGFPKVTYAAKAIDQQPYPSGFFRLGTPAPAIPIVATVSGAPTSETAISESRIYTYTFVSSAGEESAPADASNEVTVKPGQTVSLMLGGPPSGLYDTVAKRIYRSVTGTNGTEYLFVAEVADSANSYDDNVPADGLGEVLPSISYSMLPDHARGLTAMPNGMMVAHTDYDVYFCEPFKPYAWPEDYIQTVDYPIVGLSCFGTTLVVLTTGVPYLMSGADPTSISVDKLTVPYACLSKKSICGAMGGVLYAAADGLVSIDYTGANVITDQLFTRREWAMFNPASMMVCVWDERIFMFYRVSEEVKGCLILDRQNGLTTSDVYATAHFTDPVTGSLFLMVGNSIVKWDAGGVGQCQWKSRQEVLPAPKNFGYGQVLATAYPLTMNAYADGALVHSQVVASDQPFRLPSGFRARYWEVELIVNSGRVRQAVLADSAAELQSV